MFRFLKITKALIVREFLIDKSYKSSFIFSQLNIIFTIMLFFFISKLIGQSGTSFVKGSADNYFSFVLIGIASSSIIWAGLQTIPNYIRNEQLTGTLEVVLASSVKSTSIAYAIAINTMIYSFFMFLLYVILGVISFGIKLNINFPSLLLILLMTAAYSTGFGLMGGGFILIFKKWNPISWIITNVFRLLGGVYFPIAVLPKWLHKVSDFLPITYSLSAARKSMFYAQSILDMKEELIILLIFSILICSGGHVFFNWSLKKAKLKGLLASY